MADFEYWKDRYDKGWALDIHIYRLVKLGILTEQDYKTITGSDYSYS